MTQVIGYLVLAGAAALLTWSWVRDIRHEQQVSAQWLKRQRTTTRVKFEGVRWNWDAMREDGKRRAR